ncbi:MAG: hypothetical protein NTY10_04425 [Candidatus Omnitrophica bacterium]|nr:hypothetical protein [Candidatus Omnitrophota bacterium]
MKKTKETLALIAGRGGIIIFFCAYARNLKRACLNSGRFEHHVREELKT